MIFRVACAKEVGKALILISIGPRRLILRSTGSSSLLCQPPILTLLFSPRMLHTLAPPLLISRYLAAAASTYTALPC